MAGPFPAPPPSKGKGPRNEVAIFRGWKQLHFRSGVNGSFYRFFFNTYKFRLESDTKLNTIMRPGEAGKQSRDIFYQSDSSLHTLRADPKNLSKVRVVAVIFGFPSFVFNELSWNPSRFQQLQSQIWYGKRIAGN